MVGDADFRLSLAASTIGALGTALVSPVLGSLTGPFDVSPSAIGLMVTAISAPAVVFIPLLGFLTDRLGRKPVIVGGLLCFGMGMPHCTWVHRRVHLDELPFESARNSFDGAADGPT